MNIHIRGGRLIDPANQLDAEQDLFVEAGKVVAVGQAPQALRRTASLMLVVWWCARVLSILRLT